MPSLIPFEIYDTSALSLHKKQSSTYSKYACGCFLYAPSICLAFFQKANGKIVFNSQWSYYSTAGTIAFRGGSDTSIFLLCEISDKISHTLFFRKKVIASDK